MINIDHIVLRVSNFSDAEAFYRKLFEYAGWKEIPDAAVDKSLGFQQENGFTIWIGEASELQFGKQHGWLDHYALSCNSPEEVDRAYQFCMTQEWKILSEPKSYPKYGHFYGFSFEGPDGLKLEFVCR